MELVKHPSRLAETPDYAPTVANPKTDAGLVPDLAIPRKPWEIDPVTIEVPEEVVEAFKARYRKEEAQRLGRLIYAEHMNRQRYPAYTAEQLRARLVSRGLVLDTHNETLVWLMCLYFTSDERFEALADDEGNTFSLSKGLLLFGNIGCGKTHLMRVFAENPRQAYFLRPCDEIVSRYRTDGEAAITSCTSPQHPATARNPYNGSGVYGLCFDDLGVEQEGNHFGNRLNVMAEILTACYTNPQMHGMVHLTTNLTRSEIEAMYGVRVGSRFRELFNTLAFPEDAPDRRA